MDYYVKYHEMDEDKLLDEIEVLNKRAFKIRNSALRNQLLDMIKVAQEAYKEKQYVKKFKDAKDEVIEIGSIESEIVRTDYTKEELLVAIVDAYRKGT